MKKPDLFSGFFVVLKQFFAVRRAGETTADEPFGISESKRLASNLGRPIDLRQGRRIKFFNAEVAKVLAEDTEAKTIHRFFFATLRKPPRPLRLI